MNSYRDLDIYTESKKLAVQIHKISLSLPKFELFEEASQIRRSSKSVAINIVEGFGRRRYKADYIKHLVYANAECEETINHLDFLYETESWKDKSTYDQLVNEYLVLSKKINKFIQWIEDHWMK